MKKSITLLLALIAIAGYASIPDGYYKSADGKKYTDLKSALTSVISNHIKYEYSSLWVYYHSTYYHLDNKYQVLDMYSDTKRYYDGTPLAVAGMNKEHAVPQSWWTGGTNVPPGTDLFNVMPSDADANSKKANHPLGIVSSPTWTNGVTTIGEGTVNGYSDTFFEPADKYKGDFARIYLYMATCYPDIWTSSVAMDAESNLTLKSWIIPMLIEWSKNDPVDVAEIQRNEDIYLVQKNRNPFIDYPELVNYIWGDNTDEAFNLADHKANEGTAGKFITFTPSFSFEGGTKDEPKECTKSQEVTIDGTVSTSNLFTRINGGEWKETKFSSTASGFEKAVQTVTIEEDTHIEAYCTSEGHENSDTISYYYHPVDYSKSYLLYAEFDGLSGNCTATGGQTDQWTGDDNFPDLTSDNKVFQAGSAIRLGTKSVAGSITSKALDFNGGTLNVEIGVKGWSTVEGSLNVTVTGAEMQNVTYTSKISDSFETKNLTFTNVSAKPTITIATSAKRCFIDKVYVKDASVTAIKNITVSSTIPSTHKYLDHGRIIIDKNGKKYTLSGQKLR